ncbi:MAG: hypothetical protein ACK4TA_11745 [Saprospiraceae bacterium]
MDVQLLNFDLIDILDNELILQRCVGQNAKNTLVIFQTSENEAELRIFLEKVFAAAQVDLVKDTCVLSVTPLENFSFSRLYQHFDLQTLIVFGIPPVRLGIHLQVKPYEILRYENCTYVFADDLQAIYEERQQGGKRMSGELWKVLQTLFLK